MPQIPAHIRIQQLESELAQSAALQNVSNARIQILETELREKDASIVVSYAKIQELDSKLSVSQHDLQGVQAQLEELQLAQIARLIASSEWAAAVAVLEALVRMKKKQLVDLNATNDDPQVIALSKALGSHRHNLGELCMKANDFVKAELYTKEAYDEQVKLLGLDSQAARLTQLQLCKILRLTGSTRKISDAQIIYYQNWTLGGNDQISIECGHELGCLYRDQGDYDNAAPQFRRVWETRRAHTASAERDRAMSTVEQLLSILALQRKEDDSLTTLELLWDQENEDLVGKPMLQYADALANIYWKKEEYIKAEPVLASLWLARETELRNVGPAQTAERDICLGNWFLTGYRYANTLTKIVPPMHTKARTVLEQLWNSQSQLPTVVDSRVTVSKIAGYYAAMLLYSGNTRLAEDVARRAWQEAKDTDTSWHLNEAVLYVGEQYAKALNVNRNISQAKKEYKVLFNAWKRLSELEPGKMSFAEGAIKNGRAWLSVLKAEGKTSIQRKREIRLDIEALELRVSSNAQPRLASY